jgi:hypothetical protein
MPWETTAIIIIPIKRRSQRAVGRQSGISSADAHSQHTNFTSLIKIFCTLEGELGVANFFS